MAACQSAALGGLLEVARCCLSYRLRQPAKDVAGSIRSMRVIDVLARVISIHGAPALLRSDSGPEFVSRDILTWPNRIDTAIIDPGKPSAIGGWGANLSG